MSFRIVGRGKCAWTGLQQQRSPAEQTLPDNGTTAATTNCNGASTSLPAAAAGAAVSAQSNTTAAVDNTDAAAAAATATTAADPPAISAATSADGAAKSDLALHYSGEEVYVDETVFLVGSKNGESDFRTYYVIRNACVLRSCCCSTTMIGGRASLASRQNVYVFVVCAVLCVRSCVRMRGRLSRLVICIKSAKSVRVLCIHNISQ